jgi:replicative DNA helicase
MDEPGEAEIILAKHRNGPIGTVNAMFHPRHRIFTDVAYGREGQGP